MTTDAVLSEKRSAVTWIRLNRPKSLNALSTELVGALSDTLDRAERDATCRVIVLTGVGRAFCAGGDLKEADSTLDSSAHSDLVQATNGIRGACARLERSSRPVIAAVNGVAVAGGLELILSCDIVLAAQGVKIGDGHIRYGLIPGSGGSVRLPKKVPFNIANYLLMTGELATAEDFLRWGLVHSVLPLEQLERAASDLAEKIASLSPLALKRVKQLAQYAITATVGDGLTREMDELTAHIRTDDYREGIAAFGQKRAPEFKGR